MNFDICSHILLWIDSWKDLYSLAHTCSLWRNVISYHIKKIYRKFFGIPMSESKILAWCRFNKIEGIEDFHWDLQWEKAPKKIHYTNMKSMFYDCFKGINIEYLKIQEPRRFGYKWSEKYGLHRGFVDVYPSGKENFKEKIEENGKILERKTKKEIRMRFYIKYLFKPISSNDNSIEKIALGREILTFCHKHWRDKIAELTFSKEENRSFTVNVDTAEEKIIIAFKRWEP